MIKIRKANFADVADLQRIFQIARDFMKSSGNPNQWKDSSPTLEVITQNLNDEACYVVIQNEKIVGTFTFRLGIDETYLKIENGDWLNDAPYGTIHTLASSGSVKGIFKIILDYLKSFKVDIRIDTHEDNKVMLHLLEKYGFAHCGTIYLKNGEPRLAFQKEYHA